MVAKVAELADKKEATSSAFCVLFVVCNAYSPIRGGSFPLIPKLQRVRINRPLSKYNLPEDRIYGTEECRTWIDIRLIKYYILYNEKTNPFASRCHRSLEAKPLAMTNINSGFQKQER